MAKKSFINLGNALANRNEIIDIKPGSILNAVSEFAYLSNKTITGATSDDFVTKMAEKLNNELSLYRESIFPMVKEFISELTAKAPIVDNTIVKETSISAIEVKSNSFIDKMASDGLLSDDALDYGSGVALEKGVVFPTDFEALSDVTFMFKTSDYPETELLDEVLQKYSNLELKNFLNKYGVVIYSSYNGSSLKNDGRFDYRSLGINNKNIIFFIDYICLMYGYISHRLANKVATGTDVETYVKDLTKVKEDLAKMISIYNNRLRYFENNNILVVNNSDGRGDEEEDKKVWVVSSIMDKYLNQAQLDAWSSVNGLAPAVIGSTKLGMDLYKLPHITMSSVLAHETTLIDAYQNYVNVKLIGNHNVRIEEIRKLYLIASRYVWDKYMSPDLVLIGLEPETYKDKTQEEVRDSILKEVEAYIKTCKDGEVTRFSTDIVFYIIGRLFVPRTNFYKFAINTSGNKLFDNFSKLHPDNELALSTIVLIAETLVDGFH